MPDSVATTTQLLEQLHDNRNSCAWTDLDVRIRPVIVAVAMRVGLDQGDAADVAQETMMQFMRDYQQGKYQRGRGRLRAWIMGIARHRIADHHRQRKKRREHHGLSIIEVLSDNGELDRLWTEESYKLVLSKAMSQLTASRINPKTIKAFDLLVMQQWTPQAVAEELGMTIRSVYLAKHRCLSRLQDLAQDISES